MRSLLSINSILFYNHLIISQHRACGFLAFCGTYHSRYLKYNKYNCHENISTGFRITTAKDMLMRRAQKQSSVYEKKLFFSSTNSDNKNNNNNNMMSVELLADQLANSKYTKIIALVGAGVSCSAGIPDFRTPGSGLYDQLQRYNLPFPEAIFELNYYQQNPLPFIHLCKEIWPGQENGPKPTLSHAFLKLLGDKKWLHRIYTQNIDGLEALAGISTDKLVECHGHFRSSTCIGCQKSMSIEDCRKTIIIEGSVPICTACGSLVKPNIVFFGEKMPSRFQELISKDMEECDLLLILGTSLLVTPVADIPSWVSSNCPRILLNRELVGDFIGRSGGDGASSNDLFLQGDCDDSVQKICDLANWREEMETLRSRKIQ